MSISFLKFLSKSDSGGLAVSPSDIGMVEWAGQWVRLLRINVRKMVDYAGVFPHIAVSCPPGKDLTGIFS